MFDHDWWCLRKLIDGFERLEEFDGFERLEGFDGFERFEGVDGFERFEGFEGYAGMLFGQQATRISFLHSIPVRK